LVLYTPLGMWLYMRLAVPAEEQQRLAAQFVMPDRCRPEPGESAAYQVGILFVTGCLFVFSFIWKPGTGEAKSSNKAGVVWLAELGLAVGLLAFCVWALRGPRQAPDERYYHVCLNVFFEHPVATLPALLLTLIITGRKLWGGPTVRLAA